MKYSFFLSLFLFMGFLSACNYEELQPSFKSEKTFENGTMQSKPNFAQFREIPIPEKATMDLEKTLMFGNEPLIGRLAFNAPYNQANMFDFYMQEMPKFGWKELTAIRSINSYLTFSKDNRIATISLSSTKVSGTDVIFDISVAKNSRGY